jgi:hypothetical protein
MSAQLDTREADLLALMERDAHIWHQHYRTNVVRGVGSDDDVISPHKAGRTIRRATVPTPMLRKAEPLPPTYGQKRAARLMQLRENGRHWLASLTPERREARRLSRIEHKRKARAAMTPEQRELENAKRRARMARETPGHREHRLAVRRAWKAAKGAASAPATRPVSIGALNLPRARRAPQRDGGPKEYTRRIFGQSRAARYATRPFASK